MHGLCSCLECQRATGSSVFHHGYWPEAAIRARSGETRVWRRLADSGRWIDNHFCPVCGCAPLGFGPGHQGEPMAAINVRCLEDFDPAPLPRVAYDGKSL